MPEGNTPSTSATALTEDAAAERIASLFSDEEHKQAPEPTSHAGNRAAPDIDVEDEPHDDAEESEESEADAENAAVEGDEADDEETNDEDVPAPKTYRVKVDGQEIEVTEDELRNGYS